VRRLGIDHVLCSGGAPTVIGVSGMALQLSGTEKGENHTEIWDLGARRGGSLWKSNGGGETAKSGEGGVVPADGAGKMESGSFGVDR
jgi:hypothetical protein